MRPLVWFRTDLRTTDNLALHAACRAADRGVVCVFLVSPGEWLAHDWAPVKVGFVMRTLEALRDALARLNIPLIVETALTPGEIAPTLTRVARAHGCDGVWFNREYEVNEHRRDAEVESAFARAGLASHAFDDQVYARPGDVRTGEGRFFTVFTPFKKALYNHMLRTGVPEPVGEPRRQPEPAAALGRPWNIPPGTLDRWASPVDAALWPAGEREAGGQLRAFVERRIRAYKTDRDFPAAPGTSVLSPHLNIGSVSCRQCLHAALEANAGSRSPLDSGNDGIVHWISELVWREFYIHIMVGFPRVCMHRAFQPATEKIRWNHSDERLEAWKAGRTGVPIVDAGMRQLLATGWMHNRVRMITAMYLTKNLFLDWRLGEKHFMLHLVDGFLASNNGGWQWSASTGTDAAPYFRVFNPVSQSKKFDPDGSYIRRFVPELAGVEGEALHEPWTLPGLLRGTLDYPEPLVDLGDSRRAAIEAFQKIKS